ncbi:SDR family oxidoreductase [Paenibacillus cellulositrophicus]|jgi:3-oxoacyl-[acyl-carrier protein] reductase|uniref:3-oxoacyl-ACP reductase n=3 Tax=Paenibacillus TaxID=44249 RepID=A0A1R1EEK6_9BACL|nr:MULTISPECIES: SDR family oxidoreductase [Paenibacillus]KAF9120636.1 3-oxoacyl-[acyl-carrier-protein] reductase FabG1 [Mortierella sp. GBA39]MBJ9992958.1 SDR family oxidoreductase [Paenibacillus sp. S28]MCM3000801.1 SDR family oxidoreductase [Paenibacillus cellulositrophicus]MEC0179545.1 SDR family oxidoreductase [Paenibacillus favisporus]OMF50264.1 3-oxoacyl-ACP reductase [Paenibacillus rhizosphaerae]
MDLHLEGKKALVIASSQGLGKAIAAELVREGADVMLVSRSDGKLEAVQQELQKLGSGVVEYYAADITIPHEVEAMVRYTAEKFGRIDILVNNGGGPSPGTFETLTDEDWDKAFQLNLLSYVRMIREVLPHMKGLGGHIVNLTSTSIKQPIPGLILSNTFRNGVAGMSKSLSQELAQYGILVNTVAPGRIETDRIIQLNESNAKAKGVSAEEVAEQSQSEIPLGRYGTPEEFAKGVVFLLSGANTYITGTTLVIDGGLVQAL